MIRRDNIKVRRNNYKKFKHASMCGCNSCQLLKYNKHTVMNSVDYFDPEDQVDEYGWF